MQRVPTNATVSVINNRGNLGAVFKDVTSSDAIKGYVISGVTAGLTAAYFDGWTGTHSDPNTGKIVGAKLSTWEGVGQFAGNQVLQNGTSALLSSALGNGGGGSDALKTALFNTLAAASFNAVGDYTYGNFAEGTPPKVIIHAMVGGLLSKATGGDFRTGALAAGANEALVGHLNSLVNGNKNLLTMSSQIVGALAAATQKDADASSIEKGSWVARNATQYNKGLHEPAAMELEKARNENPDRAERLDAAACALVHCSASVPTSDKNYEGLKALEAKGAGYTRELADLKATGQFDYGYIDSADDFITRHDEAVTRTGAVIDTSVNTYIGGTSAVGAVITLPGCASIIGCLAPAALGGLATLSFNNAAESAGAITQPYVSTEGQRVLSSFNPASKTPDESALAAMAINAAASVAEAIILRGAGKLVLDAFGAGAKGISITIEPKIADQMGKRGWTESSIQSVIDKPVKTVVTKDTRFDTVSGSRLNDPATGYIAKDGSYVVRNDRTGAIVQVSNKKDPEWVAPWD
ncbi:Filamentous hemagglutinin, intein-containing [Pseudomonas amygdali pv. photiniae]|uniref:Filamentous hemagglutinin, intein-containing n=1 Tax=Pseudomonas amygdali pv. photiniae TaxID=251724 RepID=A0A0N8RYC5_PSEA0|nr:Filamentous hemagglutinin, intein-containing [Pseudomonas amygdali pv. photiniae]RMS49211.1 Filamentous hemagglutinin, intein-containing [Pseudomonas amygdali pv. photiniae]